MRTCQNCGATITCGCQDRVASDGKLVCSNCITAYEQKLTAQNVNANENPPTQ